MGCHKSSCRFNVSMCMKNTQKCLNIFLANLRSSLKLCTASSRKNTGNTELWNLNPSVTSWSYRLIFAHLTSKGAINTQTHKRLSGPPGVWPTLYLTCAFNTDNSMWYLLLVGGQKALRWQQRKRIRKKEVVKSGQLSGLRVICSTACNWFCVIVVMSDRY